MDYAWGPFPWQEQRAAAHTTAGSVSAGNGKIKKREREKCGRRKKRSVCKSITGWLLRTALQGLRNALILERQLQVVANTGFLSNSTIFKMSAKPGKLQIKGLRRKNSVCTVLCCFSKKNPPQQLTPLVRLKLNTIQRDQYNISMLLTCFQI